MAHDTRRLPSLLSRLRQIVRDKRGVGAVEFAIIAPVLLMVYIGAFEISVGFNIARKVTRASSTVADLMSQEADVTKAELDGGDEIARSILAPFDNSKLSLKITGIKVTGSTAAVVWSRNEGKGTPYAIGSTVTLPDGIGSDGAFIVRTELVFPHELLMFASGLLPSTIKTVNLSRTSYFRQRIGENILCSDC